MDRVDTDYLALVENDVLFSPSWLDKLIAACQETPADVASPILFEGRGNKEHFDKKLGRIVPSSTHPGKYEVLPLAKARNATRQRTKVDFVEQHCLVFRTSALRRVGHFGELYTRDDVDLGFALWNAGCSAVLEPAVQVHFVAPSWRPEDDELPFYRNRWDLKGAAESRERIRHRWNLVDTPGDLEFVRYRNLIARLPEVQRDLADLSAHSHAILLLENGDWFGTDIVKDLPMIPFPSLGGRFGGFPASDYAAITELDRVIQAGAERIVVAFPAFWWLDHLPGFTTQLKQSCRVLRDDDLLKVFEVRELATANTRS